MKYIFFFIFCLGCWQTLVARDASRPNIVLIMVDDLGVEALSCYDGVQYKTPRIDALAKESLVFDRAFCTPVCTPTRVQLLTGLYPHNNGWDSGIWKQKVEAPAMSSELPTLAKLLKQSGYATCVAGKWQLAHFEENPNHPKELGFDKHCLWSYRLKHHGQNPPRFWKPSIWQDGKFAEQYQKDHLYGPDIYSNYILNFIEENKDNPFFAYYPMTLTHKPFLLTPDTVGDKLHAPMKSTVGKDYRKSNNDLFASNLSYLDKLLGKILDKLKALDLEKDTLVIFTTDNGTVSGVKSKIKDGRIINGGKKGMSDKGAMVPFIVRWPGRVKEGRTSALIDFTDIYATFADITNTQENASCDGLSMLPLFEGEKKHIREWVYVQESGRWFLRNQNYCLHSNGSFYDVADIFKARRIKSNEMKPEEREALKILEAQVIQLHKGKKIGRK